MNRQAAHCAPGRTMQWLLVQRGSWLEKLRLSRGRMTRLNTVRYALRTTFENARFLSCALAPDSRPPPPVTHRLCLDHRELLQQGCCTAMRMLQLMERCCATYVTSAHPLKRAAWLISHARQQFPHHVQHAHSRVVKS